MLAAVVALAASSAPPSSPPSAVCSNLAATFTSPPFSATGGQMLAAALDSSPSGLQTAPSRYCVMLLGDSTELVMGLPCRATSADSQTVRDIFVTNCVAHPRFPPTPPLALLSPSPPPSAPAQPPSSGSTSLPGHDSNSESEGLTAPVIAGIAVGAALGIVAIIVMSVLAVKHVRKGGDAAVVREYRDKSNQVEITQVKPA